VGEKFATLMLEMAKGTVFLFLHSSGFHSRFNVWISIGAFLHFGMDYDDLHRVADFLYLEDMERAIRKLDGTELDGKSITIEVVRLHDRVIIKGFAFR
jgi:hypothetical protein